MSDDGAARLVEPTGAPPASEPARSTLTEHASRTLRWAFALSVLGCLTFTLIPAIAALVLARRAERDLAESGDLQQLEGRVATVRRAANLGVYLGIVGLVLLFVYAAQGGLADVGTTFFNGRHLQDSFGQVLKGFWLNVQVFVIAEVLVLIWGLSVALLRALPGRAAAPLRWFAIGYVDLFRGLPAIITIYLIGFGLPIALPDVFGGTKVSLMQLGIIALTLVYGAYVGEVYRAGIQSVHWSQTAAARSLGLSHGATMRHVVVPQAVRRVVQPLLNDFIGLQKDTALLSVIGVLEGFSRARIYAGNKFNLSSVVGLGLCFVVITIPMTRFADYLLERDLARTQAG